MTLVKFFFIYYYLKQLVVKFRFTFQKVIQSKLSEEALCGVGQIKKKKIRKQLDNTVKAERTTLTENNLKY